MGYSISNLELRRLVAPMSPDEFIAKYWQTRSVLIPGSTDWLPIQLDRERLLDLLEGGSGFFLQVRAGADSHPINRRNAREAFESGLTLCIDNLETEIPELAAYVLALQAQLNFPGSVTVASYLSPNGTGFSHTHIDGRIALTVQLEGAKRWRYAREPFVPWPVRRPIMGDDGQPRWPETAQPWETAIPHEPIEFESAILTPGDVLCVPAGAWHAAEATEGVSLSLRIGFEKSSAFRFLDHVLAEHFESDPAWRALPGSWQDRQTDPSAAMPIEVTQYLAERLDELKTFVASLTEDSPACQRAWRRLLHSERSVKVVEGHPFSSRARPEPAVAGRLSLDPDDGLAVADDLPVLYGVERGVDPDGDETVVILHGRTEIALVGDGLSDFIRRLLLARRFAAREAMEWGPDGEPLEWDDVAPVLESLVERGVLRAQPDNAASIDRD